MLTSNCENGLAEVRLPHQEGDGEPDWSNPSSATALARPTGIDPADSMQRSRHISDSSRKTVLLVEDERVLCALNAEFLRSLGYSVTEARDASEAIRKATALAGSLDLLVTDINMPGMNGEQLASELRRRWPALHVLYVSGWNRPERPGLKNNPTTEFLEKPFTRSALESTIRGLLERESEPAADRKLGPMAVETEEKGTNRVIRQAGANRLWS